MTTRPDAGPSMVCRRPIYPRPRITAACFVEQHIVDALVVSNFEILHRDYCPLINHNLPRYDSYQFLVRRTSSSDPEALRFGATSNFEMDYEDYPFVKPTIALMRDVEDKIGSDKRLRDIMTFGLMLRFHDWTKRKIDGKTAHAELRDFLTEFETL